LARPREAADGGGVWCKTLEAVRASKKRAAGGGGSTRSVSASEDFISGASYAADENRESVLLSREEGF